MNTTIPLPVPPGAAAAHAGPELTAHQARAGSAPARKRTLAALAAAGAAPAALWLAAAQPAAAAATTGLQAGGHSGCTALAGRGEAHAC